ncbi:peptidoglycan-binding domain-containing protein [Teredinibacter haidensis]|uniref:peptidoglycan-binding domain-containing protein n=1 Tax=Teredinibacter haidensis TaxID=2731755 RepID=UPI0009F933E4|nr:peptidoglycan-binding domain-containing protein [Teredinibacter haidensis]
MTRLFTLTLIALAASLSSCASNDKSTASATHTGNRTVDSNEAQVVLQSEQDLQSTYENSAQPAQALEGNSMLPPNAKPGECYARVWVEPTYSTHTKKIVTREKSEKFEVIPARYEWVEEPVLVQQASTKLVEIPASYDSVSEKIQISDHQRTWMSKLSNGKPVSEELLRSAQASGVNIESAEPGVCYHEHVTPAEMKAVSKRVEIEPASFRIETASAEYQWVEKQRLIKEASTQIAEIPARYETFSEQVVDRPAHTSWKKGAGPVQRMNDATGEIMCLVEVPATYKTISSKRVISPARIETKVIPAEYETVKVKELVIPASENKIEIPAKYETITYHESAGGPQFHWHEIHDMSMTKASRTGNQICLTEKPAQFKTVQRRVLLTPASTQTVEIPAVYETKKVNKLISEAHEMKDVIPATYETVEYRKLEDEGKMEWRSILCDTNATPVLVTNLQRTLNEKGFNAGAVDGVIGRDTIKAINAYQAENDLPQDRYINMETIRHLNLL